MASDNQLALRQARQEKWSARVDALQEIGEGLTLSGFSQDVLDGTGLYVISDSETGTSLARLQAPLSVEVDTKTGGRIDVTQAKTAEKIPAAIERIPAARAAGAAEEAAKTADQAAGDKSALALAKAALKPAAPAPAPAPTAKEAS